MKANTENSDEDNGTDLANVGILLPELFACLCLSTGETVFAAVHSVTVQPQARTEQGAVPHVA